MNNFMNPANPISPVSPLNPVNPLHPLNPLNPLHKDTTLSTIPARLRPITITTADRGKPL